MKKNTWKTAACLLAALLMLLPALTGCDKSGDEPETTLGEESAETTEETIEPETTSTEKGEETTEPEDTIEASKGLMFVSNGDGTCFVSGIGECTDADVVIPATSPDGDTVTSIGEGAFFRCTSLTSITVPDSVTSLKAGAFMGCTGLANITLPNSVTSLGAGAFAGCDQLIQVEQGVQYVDQWVIRYDSDILDVVLKSNTIGIGDSAFNECAGLISIVIPSSVTNIGEGVFDLCEGLVSITVLEDNPVYHSEGNCLVETQSKTLIAGCRNSVIPTDGSVTSIGEHAFYGCKGLTSIIIPESVTSIGNGAFSRCEGLESITISESVTSIGERAFFFCVSLTSVTMPKSVMSIGNGAFSRCEVLESITIPESVTCIAEQVFSGCKELKSIAIPDSVTCIGNSAFSRCKGLESITIPESVTSIGIGAFFDCATLTDVHYSGTTSQWESVDIGDSNDPLLSATIHCTDGDITPEQ